MSDGPEWFAPKRYGYGAGLPISWQGWVASGAYLAAMLGLATLFKDRPIQLFAIVIPITLGFVLMAARTTRGGWRWRWGEKD